MRKAAFQFSESGGSLNRPNLFTELPFLYKSLPNPPFTELPPPFSLKSPFSHWKVLRRIPFPKNRLWFDSFGGHLRPVTLLWLKAVIRIFRIFRVFVSAFSAFSALSAFLLGGIHIFAVSGSNRWFRKSDRPALLWPALGDRDLFGTFWTLRAGMASKTLFRYLGDFGPGAPGDYCKWPFGSSPH